MTNQTTFSNRLFITFLFLFTSLSFLSAQKTEEYIYTKEGEPIAMRESLIKNCLIGLKKEEKDTAAVGVCNCYTNLINRHFTKKQYEASTLKGGGVDLEKLVGSDAQFKKKLDNCFQQSGQAVLLGIGGQEEKFVEECIKNVRTNSKKTLDMQKVRNFCTCRIDLIKNKKLNDTDLEQIYNPNSELYYEMMYRCGNPFNDGKIKVTQWTENNQKDVSGPATDTIVILNLEGMTYSRLTIGNATLFWLFDTGASDMLITEEMERDFRKQGIVSNSNYLGENEYEMANGVVEKCKAYNVSNIKVGKFTLNNVTVAVSKEAKKIIIGRSLMNKFSSWRLDNRRGVLILTK